MGPNRLPLLCTMALRWEWLTDLGAIEALEEPWRALEASVNLRSPLVSCDALLPWYRHYKGRHGEPLLGAAWQGSELVGLAPLVQRKTRLGRVPVRRIDFASHDAESGEFLVLDGQPEIVAGLVGSLARSVRFDVACFGNLEPDSPVLQGIERSAGTLGLSAERRGGSYALVDLKGGYDAYCRAMSRNFRRNLRRHGERIAVAGGASIEGIHFEADTARVAVLLERTFKINDSSWKAKGRGPLAMNHRSFFLELGQRFGRRGMLDVSILRIGARDTAYLVGLAERGVYYDVTLSFDDALAELAPGHHLIQEVLQRLPAFGVHTLVSHGVHEYKRRWDTAFPPLVSLFLFQRGLRARLSRFMKFRIAPAIGWREDRT